MMTSPPIETANLGMADSLILMILALVVFGPRRLPQIGRQIGRLMYELRKASNDFKFQMEEELRNAEEADRRKKEEERLQSPALEAPATAQSQPENTSPYVGEAAYPPPVVQPPSVGEQITAIPSNGKAGDDPEPTSHHG